MTLEWSSENNKLRAVISMINRSNSSNPPFSNVEFQVRFNVSSNPEIVHGCLQLVIFTWENTLISNSAVFPQNQALSGVICTFNYTYILREEGFDLSLYSE